MTDASTSPSGNRNNDLGAISATSSTGVTIERETLERAIAALELELTTPGLETTTAAIAGLRAALAAQPAEAQQEPVAWRHSKTGRLYDSVEEVPLADGDEWAEPLYSALVAQQEPAAWRQWSTKLHDWDYSTNRGDLRSDTPAEPLFVAAAQPAPAAVPPEGGIVVSKNEAGQIVCVSRQDEDGQFLSIIAESADAVPPGMALVPIEPTPGIITTGTVALMKASDSDLDATREEIAVIYRAMIAAAGDKP